jgi:L-lactate dehydrogenase
LKNNAIKENNMKIGIVGAGVIGSAAANAIVLRGISDEVVLVDVNQAKCEAQAADVRDAALTKRATRVTHGNFKDLKDASLIVLTPGLRQKNGRDRKLLLEANSDIFRKLIPELLVVAPRAVLIVASQPVDALTMLTTQLMPTEASARVIGVGTALETLQLRAAIARKLEVNFENVHGCVIGEEGNIGVIVWSSVTVAGMPLETFLKARNLSWNNFDYQGITDEVVRSNQRVIEGKGVTSYGIGAVIADLSEAILHDTKSVFAVSAVTKPDNVAFSLPRLIGKHGIEETLHLPLSGKEQEKLEMTISDLKANHFVA